MNKTSVLLVDDHTVVRQGLRALLKSEEDIEVIGEAENGRMAVQFARKTPPDVVVMDVAMPLMNGPRSHATDFEGAALHARARINFLQRR